MNRYLVKVKDTEPREGLRGEWGFALSLEDSDGLATEGYNYVELMSKYNISGAPYGIHPDHLEILGDFEDAVIQAIKLRLSSLKGGEVIAVAQALWDSNELMDNFVEFMTKKYAFDFKNNKLRRV